jgi:LTXXQ motif family protein
MMHLAGFCDARAPGVTDLPIDRIAEAVQPSDFQRAALDALRQASTNAASSLKADCPTYQVLTPVGRTEAMEQRLAGTLTAVKTVEPALTKFYDLLSDEQKARFNTLRAVDRSQG